MSFTPEGTATGKVQPPRRIGQSNRSGPPSLSNLGGRVVTASPSNIPRQRFHPGPVNVRHGRHRTHPAEQEAPVAHRTGEAASGRFCGPDTLLEPVGRMGGSVSLSRRCGEKANGLRMGSYSDDRFEYRHVQLPKAMLKQIPKDYFDPAKGTLKLLWEEEWRGIGITQVKTIALHLRKREDGTADALGVLESGMGALRGARTRAAYSSLQVGSAVRHLGKVVWWDLLTSCPSDVRSPTKPLRSCNSRISTAK